MRGRSSVEVLDLLAEEIAGDGGIVVDEEAAFAVEDAAAGGEDGNLADAVGLGEGAEVVGAEHLETPESGDEHGENQRDDVLRGVELAGGELFGLAVEAERGMFGMVGLVPCSFESTTSSCYGLYELLDG